MLQGSKFILETDHDCLKYLMTCKTLRGELARYAMHLQQYDFEIHYRKGVNSANANGLSRMPIAVQSKAEDIPEPGGEDNFPVNFIGPLDGPPTSSPAPIDPSQLGVGIPQLQQPIAATSGPTVATPQLGVTFPIWASPLNPPPRMHPPIAAQGSPATRPPVPWAQQPMSTGALPTTSLGLGPTPAPSLSPRPSPAKLKQGEQVAAPPPDACSVCKKARPNRGSDLLQRMQRPCTRYLPGTTSVN